MRGGVPALGDDEGGATRRSMASAEKSRKSSPVTDADSHWAAEAEPEQAGLGYGLAYTP